MKLERSVRAPERVAHELRPEGRPADADQQHVAKCFSLDWPDLFSVDVGRKLFDAGVRLQDLK